jgi:hypothetical protein
MIKKKYLFLLSFLFIYNVFSQGTGQGELALEFRQFKDDGNVTTEDSAISVFSRLENKYEGESWKYVFRGFARVDKEDTDRSLMSIEDAYLKMYLNENQTFAFSAGYKIFNWSTTEAFHPADSINSRNYDTNLENLEKLGEPAIEFQMELENFHWTLFYFPRFERPFYPGDQSRLGLGADLDKPIILEGSELEREQWVPQYGTRFGFTIFDFDLAFHAIDHIDRNFPILGTHQYTTLLGQTFPNDLNKLLNAPVPYYFRSREYGFTSQGIFGPFLLKIEGAIRDFKESDPIYTLLGLRQITDHQEWAVGLEYSFTHDYGGETFLILEGNSVFGTNEETRAELSVFQRDAFFAVRHAINDVMGKELMFGFFNDLERSHEHLYTFSYTQRLTNEWKIKGGIRIYDAPQKGPVPQGLEAYDEDHHGYLTLTRYF